MPDGLPNRSISLPLETTGLDHQTLLLSCWSAVKAMCNHFLDLPSRLMFSLPYPYWLQIGHSLTIQSRFLELTDETWKGSRDSVVDDLRESILDLCRRLQESVKEGLQPVPPHRIPEDFRLVIDTLKFCANKMDRKSDTFATRTSCGEGLRSVDERSELNSLYIVQEHHEQASLLDFLFFDSESW